MRAVDADATRGRREQLMEDLAIEGASRCCYLPGAGNPELWPTSTCDCKYRMNFEGAARALRTSEATGCCEIRSAYRLLASEVR